MNHSTAVPRNPRPIGVWRAVAVLAQAQLRAGRNGYLRNWRRGLLGLLGLLLLTAMGFGAFSLVRLIVGFLRSPEFLELLQEAAATQPNANIPLDLSPYLAAVPSAVFFGLLTLLVLNSFGSVLGNLFLAPDLETLIVAPVPLRAIFLTRFFAALWVPYLLTVGLLLPTLLGFGLGMNFGGAYYALLLPMLLIAPLLPAGLATLLVLAVVWVIPARRARDMVTALSGLIGIGFYIFSQAIRPIVNRMESTDTLLALRGLTNPIFPWSWAGRALLAAGVGDWPALLGYGGLFGGVSLLLFGGCLLLAERSYYRGWANLADRGGRPRSSAARRGGQRPSWLLGWLPPQVRAIVTKDLRVFPRDLRNLPGVIFPLVMAGFWTYQLMDGPRPADNELALFQGVSPLLITLFICQTLTNTLGGAEVGREGRALILLLSAPIAPIRILFSKWLLPTAAGLLIGLPLLAGLSFAVNGALALRTLPAHAAQLTLLVCGLNALSVGINAAFLRLDIGDGRRSNTRLGAVITLIAYLLFCGLFIAVRVGVPALESWLPALGAALRALSWALLLGLTGLMSWGVLALGAARLVRREFAGGT